jgi:PAS domain S-box-containing protein
MQRRTIWSFALFVIVYVATMVALFTNLYSGISIRKEASREREARLYTAKIGDVVLSAEAGARAYFLSGDPQDLRGYNQAKLNFDGVMKGVVELTRGTSEFPKSLELSDQLHIEMDDLARIISLKQSGVPNATPEMLKHLKSPTNKRVRELALDMARSLDASIDQRTRLAHEWADRRIPLLSGSCFFVLILLGIALYQLRRELKTRERAMKELEASEDRLRLTLEAGQMAIWEMDLVTRRAKWSAGACQIYGVSDTSELDRLEKAKAFVHPEDDKWVTAHFYEAVRLGTYREIEFRIIRRSGEVRWVQGWAKIEKKDKAPTRAIGAVVDITDKKIARETIARQQKSIIYSAKMAALGEMAGGIAHEINTPLAIILGQADLSLKYIEGGESYQQELVKSLQKIKQWVGQTAKIIQGLRQFSRDGTHDPYHASRVSEILEKTLDLCRETFKRHGVKLEIDLPPQDLQIECRAVQISQVLLNLLQNAMNAAEASAKIPKDPWVRVEVKSDAKEIQFRVSDSGAGVPLAIREKIMQPFFTTKETGKGTGLGLSISKGLVDGHRGQLYLDGSSERTCFVVRLPLHLERHDADLVIDTTAAPRQPEVVMRRPTQLL